MKNSIVPENVFYSNVMVIPAVGHKTTQGNITEIDNNGQISTDQCSGTLIASALSLEMETKDIIEYQKPVHIDSQVVRALMLGHVIRVGNTEYRYARKGQKIYEDDKMIYFATDAGIFQRLLSYDGLDLAKPTGFIWALYGNHFGTMDHLVGQMSQDEKMLATMNLAFDNVTRG